MPIKSVKMKIFKNKKMCFFLMSQGLINPKIRFLGQKMLPVARAQTHTQTDRVTTVGTFSGFQDFFLQPIIKDRPNTVESPNIVSLNNSALPYPANIKTTDMTISEKRKKFSISITFMFVLV